jgi:hypothetical protein
VTPGVTISAGGSGRRGIVFSLAVLLAVIAGVMLLSALPGLMFGARLSADDAAHSIRLALAAERAVAGSTFDTTSVRVGRVRTVIFGAFSIKRSFVAEATVAEAGRPAETRYYCFVSRYLTGECSRLNRALAW